MELTPDPLPISEDANRVYGLFGLSELERVDMEIHNLKYMLNSVQKWNASVNGIESLNERLKYLTTYREGLEE